MMPCYLPDGGLAFVSTRRQGYSRCFGPNFSKRWHTFTLHRMNADGGDLRILSHNDVSEWFPSMASTGEILFARWDYIDRDAVTHQNLWSVRPDGTNPAAVWGNATPKPHCTFQAKPIPGSHKIAFIASAHHSLTAGPCACWIRRWIRTAWRPSRASPRARFPSRRAIRSPSITTRRGRCRRTCSWSPTAATG